MLVLFLTKVFSLGGGGQKCLVNCTLDISNWHACFSPISIWVKVLNTKTGFSRYFNRILDSLWIKISVLIWYYLSRRSDRKESWSFKARQISRCFSKPLTMNFAPISFVIVIKICYPFWFCFNNYQLPDLWHLYVIMFFLSYTFAWDFIFLFMRLLIHVVLFSHIFCFVHLRPLCMLQYNFSNCSSGGWPINV